MKNPFNKSDLKRLEDFIQKYDEIHLEIRELETTLAGLLEMQKSCVEELAGLRTEEEKFFSELSAKKGISKEELKTLATAWVMEKK